jgi:AraC-like DNA-binding protein
MQEFYKKALLSALLIGRGNLALTLLAEEGAGVRWLRTRNPAPAHQDPRVIRVDPAGGERPRFDLDLREGGPDRGVSAYTVGSGNLSCFNKLFKEEYACTPKAFRAATARDEQPAGSAQETAA